MNNNQKLFEKWLRAKVKKETTVKNYSFDLRNTIPNKLLECGGENVEDLFNLDDINYLNNLYHRMRIGGDLRTFNLNTAHQRPSAAIKKYIEFLKDKKNENK